MQKPLQSLRDPLLEEELLENGYVVVPFFDNESIVQLLDLNDSILNIGKEGIFANTHLSDIGFKKELNERIKAIYKPSVEHYFEAPLILGGSLITKPIGSGVSHPHLDWNLVKEGPFRSCNVWVPLVDLTEKNGVIEVLKGSHKLFPTYRGPNIPDRTNELQQFFWDAMDPLYLKAGEALIYDHRLVHGSKDNLSDKIRPASACAVTNQSAELRLYYWNEKRLKIEIFEGENTEHLLSNERFERPTTMKSLGYLENYNNRQLVKSDFAFLKQKNVSLSQKLKTFVKNMLTA